MNRKTVKMPTADSVLQSEQTRLPYSCPVCSMIAVESESCICVSMTLDAQNSSEPDWNSDQTINGDHDEWFGTPSEVAPAKQQGSFWSEND